MVGIWVVIAVLATAGIILIVSAWLVKAKVRLPAVLKIEPIKEMEDEKTALALSEYEQELNQLGFKYVGDFEILGASGENIHRVYLHSSEESLALVSLFSGGIRKKAHLHFYSCFQDQSSLSTDQATVPNFLDVPREQLIQRFPGMNDVSRLWNLHLKKIEELKSKGKFPIKIKEQEVFERLEQDQQKLLDHQVKSGLFKKDEASDELVPSWKFAFNFLLKVLDPIPFGVSLKKFFLALCISAILMAGFCFLAKYIKVDELSFQFNIAPEKLRFLVAGLGSAIAGILLGYLIQYRGFLWAGVVGFLGMLVIDRVFPNSWILIIISAQAGQVGNRIFEARISKVPLRLAGPVLVLIFLFFIGWMMLTR